MTDDLVQLSSVGTERKTCLVLDKEFEEGETAGETCRYLWLQQFPNFHVPHSAPISLEARFFPLADPRRLLPIPATPPCVHEYSWSLSPLPLYTASEI